MGYSRALIIMAAVGGVLIAVPSAHGVAQGPANELTYLTFSAPVEIPGQVLPAGIYRFRLADPETDRDVIQILSKDGSQAYAMLLTIPDELMKATAKPTVAFEERAPGAPEAIRAFFYPDHLWGEEFVYPKDRALALAKANHVAVPAMPNGLATEIKKPIWSTTEPSAMAVKHARLTAMTPEGREVEVAAAILTHKGGH